MLINKLRSSEDFKNPDGIPPEYFDHLETHTPDYLLKLISTIVAAFLHRLNVPKDEAAEFTDMIKERRISMLFDSFEAYDVQETRRLSREEGMLKGRQACVIDLLQELGELPEELNSRIAGEKDINVLKGWLKLAARAKTIDEFEHLLSKEKV